MSDKVRKAHTPEPWKLEDFKNAALHECDGDIYLQFNRRDTGERSSLANVRRIMACVNASAGLSTAYLERCAPTPALPPPLDQPSETAMGLVKAVDAALFEGTIEDAAVLIDQDREAYAARKVEEERQRIIKLIDSKCGYNPHGQGSTDAMLIIDDDLRRQI